MSKRVDAASWQVYQSASYVKSGNFTIVAERVLKAADSVMFSNGAVERGAWALYKLDYPDAAAPHFGVVGGPIREAYLNRSRAVIAAVRDA